MTLLLIIIYISFISLGLPDSLLGSAWPIMYDKLGVPISSAGIISMIISGGTIVSSLLSARMIRRFGTGRVTAFSVFLTAAALLLFSLTQNFYVLCLCAVPLGLGAGSVDAGLNNFVALHYEARHMSWLHCFWGIGCTAGPAVMAYFLARGGNWPMGYRVIGLIQLALVVLLTLSLPLWKRANADLSEKSGQDQKPLTTRQLLSLPGAKAGAASFFIYCSIEATVMLWGASFLVEARLQSAEAAAQLISINMLGITIGRLLSGFLSIKFSQRKMIRLGQGVMAAGIMTLIFLSGPFGPAAGLFLVGMGCAPIFPSLLHETPQNFGASHSQQVMGIQMACAYVGTTFTPPILGLLFSSLGYEWLPYCLLVFCLLSVLMIETLNRTVDRARIKA